MGVTANREAVVKTGDMVEGRYRIIKTLGAGGMGTVYLAEHALIKRRVALKVLHPELAADSNVVERFMNEARAAGTLGHPNIVESTDMGFTHDQVPYIVFEYLEGTLLTDEIYRVGGLPVRRAVRIADQMASALSAAHNANIIHRDLKSDNIFLTDKDDALDHVKVLDFGVSRFLEAEERQRGLVVGTPEFMAPEQITSPDHVDTRADIYALGVIMYEMLTARRPFSNDDDPRQLMHRIVHESPPPLQRAEVPHALSTMILERMMAKSPAHRFQTMADVQSALEQFTTGGLASQPRRRSAPIAAQTMAFEDDQPETSIRLPKPAPVRNTPWPVDTLDTPIGVGQVSLPMPPPVKRPYALYGVAGAGILMGIIGLVVGMRGGKEQAPQPVAQQQQQMQQPQQLPAAATQAAPEKIEVKLSADVPNARVVFRRRVADAPVQMEINSTDVVELVEVSAPGYKTTRYWLTFDRATYLTAHLVKGTGSVEATEEDTLVALGEVIMVKDTAPAPAAAPVQVAMAEKPVEAVVEAAKPVEAKAVVAVVAPTVAPRKIGRSAASDEVTEATTAPPAETKAEEPKPVETKPLETKPAEAQPAIAKTETVLPKEEPVQQPKQEPVKPVEQPKEVVAEPVRPAIDKATVTSVISQHRPEVLKCFSEGKKKNAQMKGTLGLQLQVEPSGKVFRVQVQSTLNAPLVAACVVKAANGWKFPTRSGGDVATVEYPFTIN
ncbi:MAG TPA: protein kinase [Kofleriaceae bacterium]|nr:protein kinase [Kofleriaceae bacterium]